MTLIGRGASIFAPLLARETYEEVHRDNRPDVILAGSAKPAGTEERPLTADESEE